MEFLNLFEHYFFMNMLSFSLFVFMRKDAHKRSVTLNCRGR